MQGSPDSGMGKILESGLQLKESGIPLKIGIRGPISTKENPESSIWNPESMAWNPESKTVLDPFTWGEKIPLAIHSGIPVR